MNTPARAPTAHIPSPRAPSDDAVTRHAWHAAVAVGVRAYQEAHGPDLAARAEVGIAAALLVYTDHLRGLVPRAGAVPPTPRRPLPTPTPGRQERWSAVLELCRDEPLRRADIAARTGRAPGGNVKDDLRDLCTAGLLRHHVGGVRPGYRTTEAGMARLNSEREG